MAVPDQFVEWCGLPSDAIDLLDDWLPVPFHIDIDGEIVGYAIVKGTEIHWAVDPAHRGVWASRKRFQDFLAPLFERRGYLTTRNVATNVGAHEFLTRIGFDRTWTDDDGIDHYMLSALPFSKES